MGRTLRTVKNTAPSGTFTNNPFYVINGVNGNLDLTPYVNYAKQIEFIADYQSNPLFTGLSPLPPMPFLEVFFYSGGANVLPAQTVDFSVGFPRLYQLIFSNALDYDVNLNNLADLKVLDVVSTGVTQILLNGNTALVLVDSISSNPVLNTIDFSGKVNLKRINNINNNFQLIAVNLNGCSSLLEATIQNNPVTVIDLTGCSSLTSLNVQNNTSLSSLNVGSCPLLLNCQFQGNNLSAAACSQIAIDLDNFGLSNGNLFLSGGTNAPFASWTVAGQTAIGNLVGRGWVGSVN